MSNFCVGDVLFTGGGCVQSSGEFQIGALIDCASSAGTAGQVLSSTGTALEWITPSSGPSSATPLVEGIVYAYTDLYDQVTPAAGNAALGNGAGAALTTSDLHNTIIGSYAGGSLTGVTGQTALGFGALAQATTPSTPGEVNLALGYLSGMSLTTGGNNILIGQQAGLNYTTESGNIIIGNAASGAVADAGVIRIGHGSQQAYIQLDAGGAIDISGSTVGTVGQVLTSAGPGQSPTWCSPSVASSATPTTEGTVFARTPVGGSNVALGNCALSAVSTGTNNIAIGFRAGNGVTTSSNNINIGNNAGGNCGCNTIIGSAATGGNAGLAGSTVLGRYNLGYFEMPVPTFTNHIILADGAGNNRLVINNCGAVGFGVGTPNSLNPGTAGQVLTSCGSTAAPVWATPSGAPAATPTASGTVLGCTVAANTAIGCNALLGNTSTGNTAVGVNALDASPSGDNNTAVGACALSANTTGVNNTALGSLSLSSTTTGNFNVGVGRDALIANTTGCCNTVVGYRGACALTTGVYNVAIGTNAGSSLTTANSSIAIGAFAGSGATGGCNIFIGVQSGCVANTGVCNVVIGTYVNALSPSGSCQLAIGFDAGQCWLTGTSTKAIKPGAGIIDCAGSCGTAGQVLMSDGANAVCWGTVTSCPGTVTSITAGAGLTGGTITSSGTVALDTTCVIQPSALTAKGDIITATAASTPTALGVGTDGQVLTACSACSSGLVWATAASGVWQTSVSNQVSMTQGTLFNLFKWTGGQMEGILSVPLNGGQTPAIWKFVLSGDPTNFNTGWNPYFSWPAAPYYDAGTFGMDYPVYPADNANTMVLQYTPGETRDVSFTLTYYLYSGSAPIWLV